jgi:dihydrofolate reductase
VSNIVVFLSVTLDGVMQAPGHPDEDRRGGFEAGGWAAPYADAITMGMASEGSDTTGAMLFGRVTYLHFHDVWAGRTDNPFSPILDAARKYVASRTLREPLPWANSVLLPGAAETAVAELRAQPGKDILILGSGDLVRSLLRADQVDRMILLIHPLMLGSGRRLFEDPLPRLPFRLSASKVSTTGVVIATYDRQR